MKLRNPSALAVVLLLAGCAAWSPQPGSNPPLAVIPAAGDRGQPESKAVADVPALTLADASTPAYLRVQPERTGLQSAADDGYNTYIGLLAPAPPGLQVFNAEGKPLEFVRQARLIGIAGIHAGILLRNGQGNSFLAPNPRAAVSDTFPLDRDPDIRLLRDALNGMTTQIEAFRNAMLKADGVSSAPPARSAPSARPTAAGIATSVRAGTNAGVREVPDWQAPRARAAVQQPAFLPQLAHTPTAEHFDDTVQMLPDGRVLMRVFFASGGRAVVRPDDGLVRLEQQAWQADRIDVRGFTDALGDDLVNNRLAQDRAEAIASLLLARGIPRERIVVESRGATDFIAENSSASGRARNRRVEVIFSTFVAKR